MKRGMAIGVLALVLSVLPRVVAAQNVATSLDEILQSGALGLGDGVYVTDTTGRRIKADVTDLSSAGLKISGRRMTWTLDESEISKIERQDSLQNGIWIGIGVGVGALVAVCNSRGGWLKVSDDECPYIVGYYGIPGLVAMAVAGAIVDSRFTKTLYQAPGSATLTLSPMLSTEHVGAAASISW